MRHIFATLLTAILAAILTGCIEDGITTSPSDQPAFSTEKSGDFEEILGDDDLPF